MVTWSGLASGADDADRLIVREVVDGQMVEAIGPEHVGDAIAASGAMDVMKLKRHPVDSLPSVSARSFEDLDFGPLYVDLEQINPVHATLVQSLIEANALDLFARAPRMLVFKQRPHPGFSRLLEVG